MTTSGSRLREVIADAGWLIAILACTLLLLSAALSPQSNWMVRATLAGFCVLAIARPSDALLIAIALPGFGIILSHLVGVPTLRVAEALVVAALFGCCVRACPRSAPLRRALTAGMSAPVALFALTVVAATVVWLRVDQVQTMYPADYLSAFWHTMRFDYLIEPGQFGLIATAAAIVESLALYAAVAAMCRVDPTFFHRGLRMLVLGGAAIALLSVLRLWEIVLRNPNVVRELRATYAGLRISPQIPDYIAAGSYFSLCWVAGLGLALTAGRQRVVWAIASVSLMAGLYLTGSRSVIGAAIGGLAVFVFVAYVRQKGAARRGVIVAAGVVVVAMVAGFQWLVGHDFAGETARASLLVREELLRAGMYVVGSRPLFGVGLDRFFLVAGGFPSSVLEAMWQSRRNPHNDLLRFAGELGLVGLTLFLCVVIPASARIWRALRGTVQLPFAGLAGGLVAFAITSMFSNPLMLREVSFVFWIALGLATGYAAQRQEPQPSEFPEHGTGNSTAPFGPPSRLRAAVPWVLACLLVVSIPFRAAQEVATLDLTRVVYGLSDWEAGQDGISYRRSGPRATMYVSSRARRVEIPLSGTLPPGVPQQVDVRLDGQLIETVNVSEDWQRVEIDLPLGHAAGPWRVDLAIVPSPGRDVAAGGAPTAGVKVGKISVIMPAAGSR